MRKKKKTKFAWYLHEIGAEPIDRQGLLEIMRDLLQIILPRNRTRPVGSIENAGFQRISPGS